MSLERLLRWARKSPIAGEALIAYVRARWRLSHESDARTLVAATRRSAGGGHPSRAALQSDHRAEARVVANVVARTLSVLPADARCMDRSLVLVDLLARRRIDATLVIGVRRDPSFRAHAWVELAGEPLLSPGDYGDGRLAEL